MNDPSEEISSYVRDEQGNISSTEKICGHYPGKRDNVGKGSQKAVCVTEAKDQERKASRERGRVEGNGVRGGGPGSFRFCAA